MIKSSHQPLRAMREPQERGPSSPASLWWAANALHPQRSGSQLDLLPCTRVVLVLLLSYFTWSLRDSALMGLILPCLSVTLLCDKR